MVDWQAFIVFVVIFALVTVIGFVAARWRRGNLDLLHEWALAGSRFGTLVSWFLVGGDLYTAIPSSPSRRWFLAMAPSVY
jgi:SSS family solute:Na+ symporter